MTYGMHDVICMWPTTRFQYINIPYRFPHRTGMLRQRFESIRNKYIETMIVLYSNVSSFSYNKFVTNGKHFNLKALKITHTAATCIDVTNYFRFHVDMVRFRFNEQHSVV